MGMQDRLQRLTSRSAVAENASPSNAATSPTNGKLAR
jgi:hypothetical protein